MPHVARPSRRARAPRVNPSTSKALERVKRCLLQVPLDGLLGPVGAEHAGFHGGEEVAAERGVGLLDADDAVADAVGHVLPDLLAGAGAPPPAPSEPIGCGELLAEKLDLVG